MREHRISNECSRVENGEQALAFLRKEGEFGSAQRPDIILLDLKLPRMNGLEVLREIKWDPELSPIPVVMLSTSSADEDKERAYELRANSYVVKPLDFDSFNQIVSTLNYYWAVVNEAV
ncbi:MAG: response regulator [Phycisphaerales bacterium]|jgi:two-component system response regulator|nr:response regulator [Phycisphaerales bacterium]